MDSKIEKENYVNEEGTMWIDKKVRLENCIVQKNCVMSNGNVTWEEQYTEFEACNGMPVKGTTLQNWKKNQMSNVDLLVRIIRL